MKKKRLSMLLGCILALAIVAGIAVPLATAATVTVEVLNPLGNFDIQYNQPLTSRDRFLNAEGEVDFNGKVIGLSTYSKVGNANAATALGQLLTAEFPGVTVQTVTALGSPWNNKTDANYNLWAGVTATGGRYLDAVIFGVSD